MLDLRNEFSCDWEGCGDDLDQNIWVFTVDDIRYLAIDPTSDGDASDALLFINTLTMKLKVMPVV